MAQIHFLDVTNRDGVQTARTGLSKFGKIMVNFYLGRLGVAQSEIGFPFLFHEAPYVRACVALGEAGAFGGLRLSGWCRAVTADVAAARNLMLAVEHCHLEVETMVAAPYVAGLAALADDEADLGAAVIEMGAGTTTLAVFSGGRFTHADGFALGGNHVTMDLARGLNTRISDAERIKTFHGSVLAGGSDERDMITVPAVTDDDREPPQFVSRASLVRIIKPRVEEILEMVRDRLAASPFSAEPNARAILTGG